MRKNTTYNIFLDDSRTLSDVSYKFNNPIYRSPFVIIKNYNDFIEHIEEQYKKDGSYPSFISFDYQLTKVKLSITEDKTIFFNEDSYQETGLECAIWLVSFCRKHNLPVPNYFVHDDNGYGKRKITKVLSEQEQPKPEHKPKPPFIEQNIPVKEVSVKEISVKEVPKEVSVKEYPTTNDDFFLILKDILKPKSRKDINDILLTKFPPKISEKQKLAKISNLLSLYKKEGKIKNIGTSKKKPIWTLL